MDLLRKRITPVTKSYLKIQTTREETVASQNIRNSDFTVLSLEALILLLKATFLFIPYCCMYLDFFTDNA